ncbi:TfoX/Sxy family protein [Ruegeria atlantica]|uniref:TfoX/Sxy family protein n=1 Tax=Ruegeria atlantica TaxID=81569 RepID=UPI00147F4775|nr:TfoX/Sxy family protein [Ruegeria atlantica]
MSDPISSIRNLGPAYEQACARAGIHSAQELRELGPDKAYSRLLQTGTKPHFIGYYVLVMGLQGRPWNDCKGGEKKALRQRFDAIKASVTAMPETRMISDLDAIGVRVSADDLKPK